MTTVAAAWASGLLGATLKGTLLLLAAVLASRLVRNRPAALRHLVWAAAVIGLLCLPVLSGVLPPIEVPGVPRSVAGAGVDGPTAATSPASHPAAPRGEGAPSRAASPPAPGSRGGAESTAASGGTDPMSPFGPLVGLWLLGVLIVLAHGAIGRLRVWWIARSATTIEGGPWVRTRDRLARQLGLRRRVALLRVREAPVPMTWGLLRPRVLLPNEAQDWTVGCRRNVLLHELAHVRRGDDWMRLLGRAAVALYWFHPLAWLALRRLRREQEEACDDYVLRDGVRPSAYAEQLVGLARRLRTVGAEAPAGSSDDGPSEFRRRMRSLLRPDRPRDRVSREQFAAVSIAAGLAVALVAALAPGQPGDGPATPADAGAPGVAPDPASRAVARPGPPSDAGPTSPARAAGRGRSATPDGAPRPPDPRAGSEAGASGSRTGPSDVAPGDPAPSGATDPTLRAPETRIPRPELVPGHHAGLSLGPESPMAAGGASAFRPAAAPPTGTRVPGRREALSPGPLRRPDDRGRIAGAEPPPPGPADKGGCGQGCTVRDVLALLARRGEATERRALLRDLARSPSARTGALLMKLSYRAPRPGDRRLVVEALGDVPGRTGDRYLYQVARANPWVAVRAAAIDELGESGGERVVPWLVTLAYHDVSPEVQKFAVGVLAGLDRSAAESGLAQIARSHPTEQVRREAVRWLARTRGETARAEAEESA